MPLPHPQQLVNLWEQVGIFLRFSPKHVGLQFHISFESELLLKPCILIHLDLTSQKSYCSHKWNKH